jgi:hypothetical protein
MKFLKNLVFAAACVVCANAAAAHQNFSPFVNSSLEADLATQEGMTAWSNAVSQAGEKSMVYVDWHLRNFMKSELFSDMLPPNAQPRAEGEACTTLRSGSSRKFMLSGRIDPANNNLLARMALDFDKLPAFTVIGCEAVIGTGDEGLRIRGFFYVPEHRIETAQEFSFIPLDVEPARLPKNFFQ